MALDFPHDSVPVSQFEDVVRVLQARGGQLIAHVYDGKGPVQSYRYGIIAPAAAATVGGVAIPAVVPSPGAAAGAAPVEGGSVSPVVISSSEPVPQQYAVVFERGRAFAKQQGLATTKEEIQGRAAPSQPCGVSDSGRALLRSLLLGVAEGPARVSVNDVALRSRHTPVHDLPPAALDGELATWMQLGLSGYVPLRGSPAQVEEFLTKLMNS